MTRLRPSAALSALLVLAGCGMAGASAPERTCFSSAQCDFGEQCVLGECTSDRAPFPIDLWVTPLASSDYLPQPVRDVNLVDGSVDVQVPLPVSVSVEGTTDVPFTATFTAQADLRRPLSFSTEVTPDQPGRVRLVQGVLHKATEAIDPIGYDLVVAPTVGGCCEPGSCVAPAFLKNLVMTADDALRVEPATDAVRVTGKVIVSETDPTPVESIQVQAFDPVSGVFSLPVVTDAETGAFCLAVAAPTGSAHRLTLRIGPSETRPTVEIPGIEVAPGETDLDLGTVPMGAHGAPLPALRRRIVDPSGAGVEAVRVVFTGQVEPQGTFSTSATTGPDGTFGVTLLRGSYTVRIQPPADAPWASREIAGFDPTAEDGSTLPLDGIVLVDRPRLLGQVVSEETGLPLAGVLVVAEPDDRLASDGAARSFSTTTDGDGAYALRVDPGSYRFRFVPPEGSDLPWAVGRALTVEATPAELHLETVAIEAPTRLPGKVLGARPAGPTVQLPAAKVEVFGRTPSGWSVLVWEGRAGDDGSFQILLPRSLAGSFGGAGR